MAERGQIRGAPEPIRRPRRRTARTLTTRTVTVACAVALVSVLVTALVAVPLGVRATEREARQSLAGKADLVAGALATPTGTAPRAALVRRLGTELDEQGVTFYLIAHGVADRQGLPDAVVRRVAAGSDVSRRPALVNGNPSLLEGRPIGAGHGIVLVQPLRTGTGRIVWRNLWLPLTAGLAAGVLAGILLAARLSRPIRAAATAAARLRAGDRTVRVPVEPPAEAEDLAHALNDLAAALAVSEARQRDFLLSISHELRTPLTTLRGYAEAIADGVIGTGDAARTGRTMLSEAQRLDRLVSDLLALARLESSDFPLDVVEVDLSALVTEAAAAWRPRFTGAGLGLQVTVPDGPLRTDTDPGRLRQVLDVLLDNALRVVPDGGEVVLDVPPQVVGGPATATVQVRDNGPGFADDDLAVVFERGALHRRYRGERSVGTGIGLALAAGLVRRLGGRIDAGHAPEGGAAFTIRLPRRPGSVPSPVTGNPGLT